jgi:hypothetical protein
VLTTWPPTNPQSQYQAIKEIYGCKDGKLTLIETVYGYVQDAHYVPETLQFPDEG